MTCTLHAYHEHIHHSRTTINDLITSYYHTILEPQPHIVPLLSSTKFQHIALIKQCKINQALITTLVERWRPKTHTFHLPWGECTITLKDVALHLGIRVDGRAVISVTTYPTRGVRAKSQRSVFEKENAWESPPTFILRKVLEKPKRGLRIFENKGSGVVYA